MSYYDTIDDDVKAAKLLLDHTKAAELVDDRYAAYKLLESFVAEIDRLRPLVADLLDANVIAQQRAEIDGLREQNHRVIKEREQLRVEIARLREQLAAVETDSAEKTNRNVRLIAEVMRFYGLFSTDDTEPCVSFEQALTIVTIERAETRRLREALIKVRAHTSYPDIPNLVLLDGLLQSIERITDAALGEHPQSPDPDSGSK